MAAKQLKQIEADLLQRGYKKWTTCLIGKEDYAWFKSFGIHEDKYAEERLKYYDVKLLKTEAKALIAEAYEQGWIECDTLGMDFETEKDFF